MEVASGDAKVIKERMGNIKASVVYQTVGRGDAPRWRVKCMQGMRKVLEGLHKAGSDTDSTEGLPLSDLMLFCQPLSLLVKPSIVAGLLLPCCFLSMLYR